MSAPESAPQAPHEVETVARRALGIAMNSLWGGSETEPLPTISRTLADEAQALLQSRVPSGPELDLALQLLSACAAGCTSSDGAPT